MTRDEILAANIRRLRKSRGWTQDDLATRSGASSIAMIESGERKHPQYDTIEKIAKAFGIPSQDLYVKPPPGSLDDDTTAAGRKTLARPRRRKSA